MKVNLTKADFNPIKTESFWDDTLSKKGFKSKEVACYSSSSKRATFYVTPAVPGVLSFEFPVFSKPSRTILTDGKRYYALLQDSTQFKVLVRYKAKKLNLSGSRIWLYPSKYWLDLPEDLERLYGVDDEIDAEVEGMDDQAN